jgi:hypothetical protein
VNKTKKLIPSLAYRVQEAVIAMILNTPLGTNLRLHDALFTIMSGRLLETRGALIPAFDSMGLNKNDCLRTREAIQSGSWSVRGLLKDFQAFVSKQTQWQPLNIAGYNVKAVDTTCIYRPRLQSCTSKHYNSTAGKALPAINFAFVTAIGRVQQQKVSIPIVITRGNEQESTEEQLMRTACEQGSKFLGDTDVVTADRKFSVLVMLESGIQNVVVRRATNITFRRVLEAEDSTQSRGRGRPRKHGKLIRPLERVYKDKVHVASEADEVQTWTDEAGHSLVARVWRGVVLTEQKAWTEQRKALNTRQKWMVVVVKHPNYEIPMVILSNLELTAEETYEIMRGRWGVEQLPLVSKQLLGGSRMFVFEEEMNFRLPELTFLAASVLMVVAGSCEEMPTGWWDLRAKPTAGRLRRELNKVHDLRVLDVPVELRKKNSVVAQLPRGYHAGIKKGRQVSET